MECGFERGVTCAVVLYHIGRDISCVVHGGQKELTWITEKMRSWFEIKLRATLGSEEGDDKHVVILGRHVRLTEKDIEYEADPKHRKLIMDHFGFDETPVI